MTTKDVLRAHVMAQVVEGKLEQADAAVRLGISVRQVRRLKRRMLDEGVGGLLSKKRGLPSNRRIAADVLATAVALIGEHYGDFGPTLACEKLEERHGSLRRPSQNSRVPNSPIPRASWTSPRRDPPAQGDIST